MRRPTRARGPIRFTVALTASVWGLGASLALLPCAATAQTLSDGVYSDGQADRGRQMYEAACASCHGDALEGRVGPPLTGDAFLAIWGARPLVDLVDKIHKTMPLEATDPLSREAAIDLVALILQTSQYPPGRHELGELLLPDLTLPGPRAASTPVGGSAVSVTPAANLAQLMRSIAFPNSNVIFNVQVKDPGGQARPEPATRPFDYVEWGSTFYPGWQAVDLAALALVESTPLFLIPGRRCENGRPVPVDQADWRQYTEELVEVGRAAYRASQSRSVDAVIEVAGALDQACANCHQVYRDVGAEGRGEGADRCRPTP